jgi:hypothetical protein
LNDFKPLHFKAIENVHILSQSWHSRAIETHTMHGNLQDERVVKNVLTELCSRVDKLVKSTKRQQVLEKKKEV